MPPPTIAMSHCMAVALLVETTTVGVATSTGAAVAVVPFDVVCVGPCARAAKGTGQSGGRLVNGVKFSQGFPVHFARCFATKRRQSLPWQGPVPNPVYRLTSSKLSKPVSTACCTSAVVTSSHRHSMTLRFIARVNSLIFFQLWEARTARRKWARPTLLFAP